MASVQQVGGVSQINDKHKAAIKEAVKEAQSALENDIKDAKTRQTQLALVAGGMKNAQPRGLLLNKTHNFKGNFLVEPPKTMGSEGGRFLHQGAFSDGQLPVVVGSKGFLIYGTYDKALPQLGYLLAWSKPAHQVNDIDRVYVQAGELSTLMKLTDSEIEHKLNASGEKSHYFDLPTGAEAAAEIKDLGGNLAGLGATFDRLIIN